MRITKAEYSGGVLHLSTTDPAARKLCYKFQEGDYEIVRSKKRRSLDANAYAWVLVNKLSKALNLPPAEIYREAIRNIGGACQIVCVQEKAAQTLRNTWEANGIGWQSEEMPSKIEGCVNIALWAGSSTYDVGQMSQLIDRLVEDCKLQDIETLPPDRLRGMLDEWR